MIEGDMVHVLRTRLDRLVTELVLASTPSDIPVPPKPGRYLLNTDAGVKKNGEAAIGVVLSDPADRPIATYSGNIRRATIPQAEYRALLKGLELARDLGIPRVRVYLDNQTVVDQVNDPDAKVAPPVAKLRSEVRKLLDEEFLDQGVYWVPRERNKAADELVQRAFQSRGQAEATPG